MIHARHADSDGWLTREDCHRAADELPGTLAGVMVLLHLAADDMDRPVKIEDILATCERILNNG
jgi:hypothetical protein